MTAAERLAYLLEPVTTNTNRQIIVADIMTAVGVDAGRLVLGTLQAASEADPIFAAAYQALVTVGISLSDDLRQGMIDQLAQAGNWTNSVRDAVKALGRITQPRWRTEGYATEPTLQQIQAEIDMIQQAALKSAKVSVLTSALDSINHDTTIADLVELLTPNWPGA